VRKKNRIYTSIHLYANTGKEKKEGTYGGGGGGSSGGSRGGGGVGPTGIAENPFC
jgi:hypothetical protein